MADNWSRKIVAERPLSFAKLDRRMEKAYPVKAPADPPRREPQGFIAPDPREVRPMRPQPDLREPGPGYSARNWPQRNPPPREPLTPHPGAIFARRENPSGRREGKADWRQSYRSDSMRLNHSLRPTACE
jgi:hypothetical protein